jgi:hypothetical protein
MRSDLSEAVQHHKDAIDDYLDTVRALYALANSAVFDPAAQALRPEGRFCVPRTMNPRDDPTAKLTPDAVIQVQQQYGLVAEAKKHFPSRNPSGPFDQIQTYDRDLLGWWNKDECIDQHDLILLTHVASSTQACDAYREWSRAGHAYERAFAIIEFGLFETGQHWYLLRRVDGRLSQSDHDERLRLGDKIQHGRLVELYEKWKFMDAEPPAMHMLLLLHDYVLPLFPTEDEFEEPTGKKRPVVEVTAERARDKMDELFCPPRRDTRQFRLPRIEWVKSALDTMVRVELAVRVPEKRNTYRVVLKKTPGKDTIEFFAGKLLQHEQQAKKKAAAAQPELF